MDFQEQFVQVLYNLIPVLQVVSGQLSQLMSEETHMPKGVRVAELSPVMIFELGPFEKADDHFYRNHRYLKAVNLKNKKIRERIAGIKDRKQPKGKKTGDQEMSRWKSRRGNTEPEKQKNRSDGFQAKRMDSTTSEASSSEAFGVLQQISAIRDEMKKLKKLSELLTNLKAEVHKMETALTVESFEKLLTVLEKSFSANEKQNKLNLINGNIFNGINNITYNNQYQIENVFAINRLPGRIESKLKEADAQIINELTVHKMNEVLGKAVNNLKGGGVPRDDFPAAEQLSLQQNEVELLSQLQKNFSRIFSHQNVSLDQINQMSRIIDFVERYHGAVGSLKLSSDLRAQNEMKGEQKSEKIGTVQGRAQKSYWKERPQGKVLCDEGFDFFGGEEEKRPTIRRKGSVK